MFIAPLNNLFGVDDTPAGLKLQPSRRMKLRGYQREAVTGASTKLETHNSTLIVMATGLGKTVAFCYAVKELLARRSGSRALILAHREELITQAANKYHIITGDYPAIEMADRWAQEDSHGRKKSVVVSSIQTQIAGQNGGRMKRFNPHEFDLLVVDEAHHATAPSYRKVIDYYRQNPNLKVLGVTATPDRADERALGLIFESVAYEYGIREGIEDGYLVPIEQYYERLVDLNFEQIHTVAGDLSADELAEEMERDGPLHGVADAVVKRCGTRRTLIFAARINPHAKKLVDILCRHAPDSARLIHGETPKDERAHVLGLYREGAFPYLVNCGVFTEGFDEPGIECVVMARPTKSRSLYTQMLGRGTRPLDGVVDDVEDNADARRSAIAASAKPRVEVMDFVGNSGRHKLISAADVLGGDYSDEVVERAKKRIEDNGDSTNVAEELEAAKQEQHEKEKREREKRQKLIAKATFNRTRVDPFDVLDIEPVRERGYDTLEPATEKQVAAIAKWTGGKVDASTFTKRRASQIIGELSERSRGGKCSFGQANVLQRYGYDTNVTRAQATKLIDAIKANGWRRPAEPAAPSHVASQPLAEVTAW